MTDCPHCRVNLERMNELLDQTREQKAEAESAYRVWREKSDQQQARIAEFEAALEPFAHFSRQFERQPLRGTADEFYGIHTGTEYEANLRLSDCKRAAELLKEQSDG